MENYYKPIKRKYYDIYTEEYKVGTFIAGGTQADGHIAYTRLDEDGNEIEGEETSYIQYRTEVGLVMYHI